MRPQIVQQTGTSAESGVFYVAFSPEREDPGNKQVARRDIPKVVGGHDPVATELAATLYEGIFAKAVRVSTTLPLSREKQGAAKSAEKSFSEG